MHPLTSLSCEETEKIAQALSHRLSTGGVLLLYGTLGAGKTTFAKALISAITGYSQMSINSPTFPYLNIYELSHHRQLCHFDLYRIENAETFVSLGLEEFLDQAHLSVIEWPECISTIVKELTNIVRVKIEHLAKDKRKITIL